MRASRVLVAAAAIVALAVGVALRGEVGHGAPSHGAVAVAERAIAVQEAGYRLSIDRSSGLVTLSDRSGIGFTSFPLFAVAGEAPPPSTTHRWFGETADTVTEHLAAAGGADLETAQLTASPDWFTVTFTVAPPRDTAHPPLFFFDGRRGFDLARVAGGFSPDTGHGGSGRLPAVSTLGRTPLTPAPLDVELHTPAGWVGVGLVQVPNATTLRVQPDGAVMVDYPLRVLEGLRDAGGGGIAGGRLAFPTFVFTTAADPASGLSEYHEALVDAGTAPARATPQPGWWQEPIVDTWGQQVADRAVRGSVAFNDAWVRHFVADVKQRYGLSAFTVVIDSRWQAALGDATPDALRFGGLTGMRALIDSLHAQGLRVLLWWPMWVTGNGPSATHGVRVPASVVDPTASGFEAGMTANIRRLLGSAAGDLNADGLKLDWTYRAPISFADARLGWGDTALYRYLSVIHAAAHAVKPDSFIEASAATPQFAAVTDGVRLYDSWTESAWNLRAAVVAAADPGVLIDGDGWDVAPADALVHAVASTVYGVPSIYFDSLWGNRTHISTDTARLLGAIVTLSSDKGPGSAVRLPDGGWSYVVDGLDRARTLAGGRGLLVWRTSGGSALVGHVLTLDDDPALIPLPRPGVVSIVAPDGIRVAVTRMSGSVRATLHPGVMYTITVG